MDRALMREMWGDMWREGNWIPSWPDSLVGLSPEQAAQIPGPGAHSIWQEVVHVVFWRRVTLSLMAGGKSPTAKEIERNEFALPERIDEDSWSEAVESLQRSHEEIGAAIDNGDADVTRVPYHLVHDAYHLGRITQIRAMQGTGPKF